MALCPETRAAATAAIEGMIASGVLLPFQEYSGRVNGALKGIANVIAEPLARQREALREVGDGAFEPLDCCREAVQQVADVVAPTNGATT